MSTIDYQLNILRDTQMVQRRLLEKQFPYIDWEKMPFSSYGDFFRLRSIMEDCGEVWTNAYGRSNDEDSSTRKYLKDYSGKGRDIELFNFGYSKQSGYNGYVQDFRNFNLGSEITNSTITESKMILTNTNIDEAHQSVGYISKANYINKGFRIKVSSLSSWAVIIFYTPDYISTVKTVNLKEGILDIPALTDEEWSSFGLFSLNIPKDGSVVIEQIPSYPGAIVGDGIDDYGQCVKDFALPDDYTVVAMRENIGTIMGCTLGRFKGTIQGAFIFENQLSNTHSFGSMTYPLVFPKLFSYQARSSFNGSDINAGNNQDDETYDLLLFKQTAQAKYNNTALYSFGIFSRTLTADELRTVENCMYAEWICMTGKLEGIEYYDILDARFRSNDEAADKRNKWVGRLGKLHMTLNNYAYSQMSGWDGMSGDFSKFTKNSDGTLVSRRQSKVTLKWGSDAWVGVIPYSHFPKGKFSVRVSFSNPDMQNALFIYYNTETSVSIANISLISGINTIDMTLSSEPNYVFVSSAEAQPGDEITIELIPDYGGALVSDGVDDYAVSDEVIDEAIGGMVVQYGLISETSSVSSFGGVVSNWIGLDVSGHEEVIGAIVSVPGGSAVLGNPWTSFTKNADGVYGLSREPLAPNDKLYISHIITEQCCNWISQLRLIKTQPTDIQLEAIKWQCRKEHEDYLIHMGWKEVE